MDLRQIEADVVLVGINDAECVVHVQPLWECETSREGLWQQAAVFGLQCAEQDGTGMVRVEIHDFRVKV